MASLGHPFVWGTSVRSFVMELKVGTDVYYVGMTAASDLANNAATSIIMN